MRCVRQSLRAHSAIIEALESRQLLSATPQLLADINTQASGIPNDFIEFNGRLYYSASDAEHGQELWTSDGTPAGTHLVKDINLGTSNSGPSRFVALGDYLYFAALTTASGFELWRTDGTESGTQMVREIHPGISGGLTFTDQIVAMNGSVYFVASTGANNLTLWRSDGTFDGTVQLANLGVSNFGQLSDLEVAGEKLFWTTLETSGKRRLWRSDGTTVGTNVIKEFHLSWLSSADPLFTSFNGALYFRVSNGPSSNELWKSDGTFSGTLKVELAEENLLSHADSLSVLEDRFYFAGTSAAAGTELWLSDGTAAGTQAVADLAPGEASFSPNNLFTIDDTLYFTGMRAGHRELWGFDHGTSATSKLATLEKNELPLDVRAMTEFEGQLYFTAFSDVFGADLWRSDGTPLGTFPWRAQIAPAGSIWPFEMGTAAGRMFFTANVGGSGMELWSTDGTYGGTGLLADLGWYVNDASRPQDFVTAGDFVYFTANDGTGRHLFSTPGPNGPVTRLTSSAYEVQSAEVEQLVPVGNDLYFVARDTFGRQYLGLTSGTTQTTHVLAWPFDADEVQIEGLTQFAAGVMFLLNDDTLGLLVCKADAGGIEIISTLNPNWSLPTMPEAVVAQGVYYFVAAGADNELWRSDGTAAGTWRVRDAVPNLGLNPVQLTATQSAFYFISLDASPTLWKTNGTLEGTLEIATSQPPAELIAAGDKLYFRPVTPSAGLVSLGVTDGTQEGTQSVTQILISPIHSTLHRSAAELDGVLYFFSFTPSGPALLRTDGTPQGTTVVQMLPQSANDIVALDDKLYFTTISTLYASDGTSAGTRVLVVPDPFASYYFDPLVPLRSSLTKLGETLYLLMQQGTTNAEPHTLTDVPATIVGRHLYYNNSKFDENTPSAFPPLDDLAIATDKTPYFAGTGTATFENISSYSRGINGVMVDIAGMIPDGLLGTLSANDFKFRRGTSDDPSSWTNAPAPQSFWTQEKTDENGDFTRVYFTWAEGAIKNTWLEITVLANGRTGLQQPDVFYFGSRIGDTGSGTPAAAVTSAADELAARYAPGINQPITSPFDFDRNGVISAGDALIARNNGGILLKLNLPAPGAAAPLALSAPAEPESASTEVPPIAQRFKSRDQLPDHNLAVAAEAWLKRANESVESSPLDVSLLNLLSLARSRFSPRR